MKSLGHIIREFGTQCHQHADDIQQCISLLSKLDIAMSVLNQCLKVVISWMKANKLNPDFVKTLLVGGPCAGKMCILPLLDSWIKISQLVLHVLVISQLDYCNTLYIQLHLKF